MAKIEENVAKDPFTEEAAIAQSAWPAYLGGNRIAWSREQYLEIVAEVAAKREADENSAQDAKEAAERAERERVEAESRAQAEADRLAKEAQDEADRTERKRIQDEADEKAEEIRKANEAAAAKKKDK